MKKWIFGVVVLLAFGGIALAQLGTIKVTSLAGAFSVNINTSGPQSARLPINGGTVTCNSSTPVTVVNTNVDAGSLVVFTLKTVGGTVGAYPQVTTITAATGMTVTCTASDTSIYNYIIIG